MNKKLVFSTISLVAIMAISCFASEPFQIDPCLNKYSSELDDTYLLLAHKWESGAVFLDLKINGTFEAALDGKNIIYGNWEVSSNQESLILVNDPSDEELFSIEYTLSDVSFHAIKIIDSQGKEMFFVAVE